jgi:hypothetical protein
MGSLADLPQEFKHFWMWPALAGLAVFSLLLVSGVHTNGATGRQLVGSLACYVLFAVLVTFTKQLCQVRLIQAKCLKGTEPEALLPLWAAFLFAGLHALLIVALTIYWIWRGVL